MKKILLIIMVAVLASCGGRRAAFDRGVYDAGVYRNDFFGLTVEVPEGVHVTTGDALAALSGAAGGSGEALLLLSQREVGTTDSLYNYNLALVAERLDRRSGVESGEQYAAAAMDAIAAARGIEIPAPDRVTIGGREFVAFRVPLEDGVVQEIFTRVERGYALVFTATYEEKQSPYIGRLLVAVEFDE
jgi:hypothetical protein